MNLSDIRNIDVQDWYGRTYESVYGIKRSGRHLYTGTNPFRQENTSSLYINPTGFYDFGTGENYTIIDFVMHVENLDFKGALSWFGASSFTSTAKKAQQTKPKSIFDEDYQIQILESAAKQKEQAATWAANTRGLNKEKIMAIPYGLHWYGPRTSDGIELPAPSYVAIPYLRENKPQLIMLRFAMNKEIKAAFPDKSQKEIEAMYGGKYQRIRNGRSDAVYNINRVLHTVDGKRTAKRVPYLVIVEGALDAETLHEAGIPAIAFQTVVPEHSVIINALTSRNPAIKFIFIADNDGGVGLDKAIKTLKTLAIPNHRASIIMPTTAKDVNELLQRQALEDFLRQNNLKKVEE